MQLVRFFYKVDTQNKAKVLRKVRGMPACVQGWSTVKAQG